MPLDAASLALSAAALSASSAAQRAAERAECMQLVKGYQNDTASVEAARGYAHCVFTLYGSGESMPGPDVILVKIVIVLALIGAGFGAWTGWREDGIIEAVMYGFLFSMLLPCLVAMLVGAGYATYWLFT